MSASQLVGQLLYYPLKSHKVPLNPLKSIKAIKSPTKSHETLLTPFKPYYFPWNPINHPLNPHNKSRICSMSSETWPVAKSKAWDQRLCVSEVGAGTCLWQQQRQGFILVLHPWFIPVSGWYSQLVEYYGRNLLAKKNSDLESLLNPCHKLGKWKWGQWSCIITMGFPKKHQWETVRATIIRKRTREETT